MDALAVSPASPADVARAGGNAAFSGGDFRQAIELYTVAIMAQPRDTRAWCNRALAYIKMSIPLLALGDTTFVLALEPGNAKARQRMAWAYENAGIFESAIHHYQRSLSPSVPRFLSSAAGSAVCAALQANSPLPSSAALDATSIDVLRHMWACVRAHEKQRTETVANSMDIPGMSPEAMRKLHESSLRGGLSLRWLTFRGLGAREPSQVIRAFSGHFKGHPLVSLDAMGGEGEGAAGVRILARKDIAAGTVVLVDCPLLTIADRSWCYHCVRPLPTTPVPCGGGPGRRTGSGQLKATSDVDVVGSRTARCDRLFCSAACAASAWEQYHEPLCGLDLARIEAYASQGVTTSARSILFAWKMLGMALQHQRRSGAGAPLVPPADLPPFCHLARANDVGTAAELISTSSDLQPSVGVIGPLEQWEMIREILGSAYDTEPALSLGWYMDAVAVLCVNLTSVELGGACPTVAAAAHTHVLQQSGAALMSAGTFFNHSCEPNVETRSSLAKSGGAVTFFAPRRVAAGTELTIAYINDAPLEHRQLQLQAQYGFDCQCAKCQRESSSTSGAKGGGVGKVRK